MARRTWSLADELSTLAHAVDAARRVASDASTSACAKEELATTAEGLAGALALVSVRLRDLGRIVRGELDPRHAWAPHNAVVPDAASDAGDVLFRAWGPKRRAKEAHRVLAEADAALAWRRR